LEEYTFKIEEVLADIQKLKDAALNGTDIIMAPDNHHSRWATWGVIKKELQDSGILVEDTEMADNHKPETLGIFIGKDGIAYAFPKTWAARPVHKIPGTKIGVTICSEINYVKPEDLDGISVLYNPAKDKDERYLKFRMLHKHGAEPLTREGMAIILMKDPLYMDLLDDSKNTPDKLKNYNSKIDSRKAREKRFDEIVDRHLKEAEDPKNSFYVRKIEAVLAERNIPVVRSDGPRASGTLNDLETVEIKNLQYGNGYTRFELAVALEGK